MHRVNEYSSYYKHPLRAWENVLKHIEAKNHSRWSGAICACEKNIAWFYLEAAGKFCEFGMTEMELDEFLHNPMYMHYFQKDGTWAKNAFEAINSDRAAFVAAHRKRWFKNWIIAVLRNARPVMWLYERLHYSTRNI